MVAMLEMGEQRRKNKLCCQDGCPRVAKSGGKCIHHGGGRCIISGCSSGARKNRMCHMHNRILRMDGSYHVSTGVKKMQTVIAVRPERVHRKRTPPSATDMRSVNSYKSSSTDQHFDSVKVRKNIRAFQPSSNLDAIAECQITEGCNDRFTAIQPFGGIYQIAGCRDWPGYQSRYQELNSAEAALLSNSIEVAFPARFGASSSCTSSSPLMSHPSVQVKADVGSVMNIAYQESANLLHSTSEDERRAWAWVCDLLRD